MYTGVIYFENGSVSAGAGVNLNVVVARAPLLNARHKGGRGFLTRLELTLARADGACCSRILIRGGERGVYSVFPARRPCGLAMSSSFTPGYELRCDDADLVDVARSRRRPWNGLLTADLELNLAYHAFRDAVVRIGWPVVVGAVVDVDGADVQGHCFGSPASDLSALCGLMMVRRTVSQCRCGEAGSRICAGQSGIRPEMLTKVVRMAGPRFGSALIPYMWR